MALVIDWMEIIYLWVMPGDAYIFIFSEIWVSLLAEPTYSLAEQQWRGIMKTQLMNMKIMRMMMCSPEV